MIVVYVASPYTQGADQALNVRLQLSAANELMDLGYCPIIPLLTHFQHICFPRPYEDWMQIDEELVRRCDVLLRLGGVSPGADREVALANSIGIPVVYSIDELNNPRVAPRI